MATVTCHTDGCGNADIGIEAVTAYMNDETGEMVPVDLVVCGVCGEVISDIKE